MRKEINAVSDFSNTVLNIMFVIIAACCLAPLLLVISVSFSDETNLSLYGFSFIPKKFTLYAYRYIFAGAERVFRGYGVTILVTVIGTCLSVLITAMFAYPLSRKSFRYRRHFMLYLFITMLFNAGLVPWYLVYARVLNLRNSLAVLIIPYLVNGFHVIVMRTYFTITVNDSILESAKIDGAGELRIFLKIILPLSKAGLATIGLFSSVGYWNDWWLSLIFITDKKLISLQYLMYIVQLNIQYITSNVQLSSVAGAQMIKLPAQSARMAMCVIGMGPIIMAYPFFQRYFVSGLTIGAVKG